MSAEWFWCCLWGGHKLHCQCGWTFLAVLLDELEFGITHIDMKTQERNHYEGSGKHPWYEVIFSRARLTLSFLNDEGALSFLNNVNVTVLLRYLRSSSIPVLWFTSVYFWRRYVFETIPPYRYFIIIIKLLAPLCFPIRRSFHCSGPLNSAPYVCMYASPSHKKVFRKHGWRGARSEQLGREEYGWWWAGELP